MKRRTLLCFLVMIVTAAAQTPPDAPTPEIVLPSQQQPTIPRMSRPAPSCWRSSRCRASSTDSATWSTTLSPISRWTTYTDFSAQGARLIFKPPLRLASHYTIMAWIQAPTPRNHGDIWHGSGKGCVLFIGANLLGHLFIDNEAPYAQTKTSLNGWYHMAITSDGYQTQCFLNGTPLDIAKGLISDDLGYEGSSPYPEFDDKTRCAGIDEQYIFNRILTADEIKQVMDFSKAGN